MPSQLTWRTSLLRRTSPEALAQSASAGRGHARIRTSLALLVMACLLPGLLLAAYFIVSDYREHKTRAIQNAVSIARAAAASLDRDISNISASLRVLATSNALMNDDLATFYRQAIYALPLQDVTNYVLTDASGRQVLNTMAPWGSPLPASAMPPSVRAALERPSSEAGDAYVSDLFKGPLTGKPILAVTVPVRRDGRFTYALSAGIFPNRLSTALISQRLPEDWVSGVLDSKGTMVARTRHADRFVGKPAVPALIKAVNQAPEGVLATRSLEGVPVVVAFSHSSLSNWTVAVAVPQQLLTGELKRSLVTLLVVSALIYAAAWWVAWRLAITRVVAPANDLLERMRGIARGEPLPPIEPDGIPVEFLVLQEGFAEMSAQLQEREKEREAKLAAEAANRAKTTFLSRMSHELRTPLNAVLGFTQVLLLDQRDPLNPRQQDMIRHIETAGRHLLDMISDVLDVSRIESGQMHIELTDVDTLALVRECRQMMAPDAAQAGLTLQLLAADDTPRVRADLTRLKQVLLNLLSNAIKYNRPAGGVTLHVGPGQDGVRFTVSDTGQGMSEEQLAHLFEPFNRLGRNNSSTPGAGIGLVICKQLLELMGSRLEVRSEMEKGSAFWFELPTA